MEVSNDTKEMLEAVEDLRQLPGGLREMIEIARKRGVLEKVRAELIYGVGQVVTVMREVADELETMTKVLEAE
jgi:hypothetical protein